MVDLRYFVVTLVSVFLSLALGLFIGANLPADDGVWLRQDALITALERDFQGLREDKQRLVAHATVAEEQLKSERELTHVLLWPWLQGQLGERRILLWELGRSDTKDMLVEMILASGAHLRTVETNDIGALALQGDFLIVLVGEEHLLSENANLIDQVLSHDVLAVLACTHHLHEPVASLAQTHQIPYVGHADSPAGQLSLLYIMAGLNDHDQGFGWASDLTPWPHPAFLHMEGHND